VEGAKEEADRKRRAAAEEFSKNQRQLINNFITGHGQGKQCRATGRNLRGYIPASKAAVTQAPASPKRQDRAHEEEQSLNTLKYFYDAQKPFRRS